MSGTATLPRMGRAAPPSKRRGWFQSLADEAVSFFKGDNNAPWAILAETVIGFVPAVGQVVDARDIIKGLVEVSGAPASPAAWFNLITALIGVIPGGGDAVKRSLRAVKSETASIDSLLDVIRRFGKGDPEKFLRDMLDPSRLQKLLDDMLNNPALKRRLGPDAQRRLDSIRSNLRLQFDAFKREIDGWLKQARKTSAEAPPAGRPRQSPVPAKPKTKADAGSKSRTDSNDRANTNQSNSSELARRTLGQLQQKALGVLGEHMADYHCQEIKRWGKQAQHDGGHRNPAKLNDDGELVQLWPLRVRGRGIDAVWKTNGRKPYAIIEAKASYDPTKSLASLLRDLRDKSGKDSAPAGKGSGKRKGTATTTGAPSAKAKSYGGDASRTPMSRMWISSRLGSAVGNRMLAHEISITGYTRHVLFFSVPHAFSHAQTLLKSVGGKEANPHAHTSHSLTREWTDNQIEKLVDSRQGYVGAARHR